KPGQEDPMIVHRRHDASGCCRRALGWFVLAALVAAPLLAPCAPAVAASEDGAVAGLKPKFVDVNGVRTRYYEAGAGEPMILVHGEGFSGHSSANVWSKNLAGLGKRFHVFAADKLASGMTGNPLDDKDYNIQGEVEHAYQFIKAMRLDKVHLVGQSRGGGLAFFLAGGDPRRVKNVGLDAQPGAAPGGGTTRQ